MPGDLIPLQLVAGSNGWSPEMGIEKFHFSHCREWRMSEFVAPTWYVDTSTEILAELASLGQVFLYTAGPVGFVW